VKSLGSRSEARGARDASNRRIAGRGDLRRHRRRLRLAALGIELPISTTLILRSIADIAASEGEDPRHHRHRLACLVSSRSAAPRIARQRRRVRLLRGSLGARHGGDRGFASISRRKGSRRRRPALVRLISLIAARFGIVVSEKTAAQLVP
jgi:hypothetical protein